MSERKPSSTEKLEIILEFGHRAILKDVPAPVKGQPDVLNTHDWEVWVKSPCDGRIDSYMDKVVFILHETFDNNKRVVTKAPFMIQESGYGSFVVNIDLYFRAPKGSNLEKTRVEYELVLQPMLKPGEEGYQKEASHRRLERMQFPTKDEDFKRRLIRGGAKTVDSSKALTSQSTDKSKDRDGSKSAEKLKDRERKEKEKDRERKEKKDEKYKDRDKEKAREKEKLKEKPVLMDEKLKLSNSKPKSDFTDLFGTPIKKSIENEKKEKEKKRKKW